MNDGIKGALIGVVVGAALGCLYEMAAKLRIKPPQYETICTYHGTEYIKTPEGGLDLSVDRDGAPVSCDLGEEVDDDRTQA